MTRVYAGLLIQRKNFLISLQKWSRIQGRIIRFIKRTMRYASRTRTYICQIWCYKAAGSLALSIGKMQDSSLNIGNLHGLYGLQRELEAGRVSENGFRWGLSWRAGGWTGTVEVEAGFWWLVSSHWIFLIPSMTYQWNDRWTSLLRCHVSNYPPWERNQTVIRYLLKPRKR